MMRRRLAGALAAALLLSAPVGQAAPLLKGRAMVTAKGRRCAHEGRIVFVNIHAIGDVICKINDFFVFSSRMCRQLLSRAACENI